MSADAGESSATPGKIGSCAVYEGRVVTLTVDSVRFPDGSTGELEMIRHPGASAVLPLMGGPSDEDPEILLIHQYRYAAGGYLYEVPAGKPDEAGEDWEVCARRELEEETGMRAGSIRKLGSIHTTPGFTDEEIHLFLAWDLSSGQVARDADEFVELVRLPLSAALSMISEGEITDAKTICTLLFAERFVLGR